MPPKKTQLLPETVEVSVQYLENGQLTNESSAVETLKVRNFVTAPAEVAIEAGMTINLGNYESGRLTVGVRIPCYREEIDFVYEYAQLWVETRIESEAKKMHEYVKEKASF